MLAVADPLAQQSPCGGRRRPGDGQASTRLLAAKRAKLAAAVTAQDASARKELCDFFRGTGTDVECRRLSDILAWEDVLLEVCHDYIQWVFPTDEPSRFNEDAPLLDEEAQRIFAEDAVIRRSLHSVLRRFLKFMGLEINLERQEGERLVVSRAANFEKRMLMCWRGPENHNWKRLSRALRCLGLAAMEEEQEALLECLEDIVVDFPGMIEEFTVGRWLEEAHGDFGSLPEQLTPHYLAGVLQSPKLLSSVCKRFFQHCGGEGELLRACGAIRLSRELHAVFGLHSDVVSDARCQSALGPLAQGECATEEAFLRWLPSELEQLRCQAETAAAARAAAAAAAEAARVPLPSSPSSESLPSTASQEEPEDTPLTEMTTQRCGEHCFVRRCGEHCCAFEELLPGARHLALEQPLCVRAA